MRTVFKYTVPLEGCFHSMPLGAKLLMVGAQEEQVTMWFEVDTERACTVRQFTVRGTGHSVRDGLQHVGSLQIPPFVWHVYEVPA